MFNITLAPAERHNREKRALVRIGKRTRPRGEQRTGMPEDETGGQQGEIEEEQKRTNAEADARVCSRCQNRGHFLGCPWQSPATAPEQAPTDRMPEPKLLPSYCQ